MIKSIQEKEIFNRQCKNIPLIVRYGIFYTLIFTFSIITISAQNALSAKWKIIGTNRIETNTEESGIMRPGEPPYRYFKDNFEDQTEFLLKRHWLLWDNYKKTLSGGEKPNKKGYMAYAKVNDPLYAGLAERAAPVLGFDFTGISGKEYVLDSITITTYEFVEYSGGGFADGEAWYDIEVPTKGSITRSIENNILRFTSSGSARLRLQSTNYYPSAGLSPMGWYTLEIKFKFLTDAKFVTVSTGKFKIDV